MNGMGTLKIRCPNTGEHVTTGVVMDEEVFKLARLTTQVFVCNACGETHVWEKEGFPTRWHKIPTQSTA